MVPKNGRHSRYLLSSNQMRLRVNKYLANPVFVYYFMSSARSISKIVQDSEATGVPKINLQYLKSFPIKLPSVSHQDLIIGILEPLDDKLEKDRQTSETLESMAQALFKSWFVDFDPVIDNALAVGNDIPEPFEAQVSPQTESVRKSAVSISASGSNASIDSSASSVSHGGARRSACRPVNTVECVRRAREELPCSA